MNFYFDELTKKNKNIIEKHNDFITDIINKNTYISLLDFSKHNTTDIHIIFSERFYDSVGFVMDGYSHAIYYTPILEEKKFNFNNFCICTEYGYFTVSEENISFYLDMEDYDMEILRFINSKNGMIHDNTFGYHDDNIFNEYYNEEFDIKAKEQLSLFILFRDLAKYYPIETLNLLLKSNEISEEILEIFNLHSDSDIRKCIDQNINSLTNIEKISFSKNNNMVNIIK